MKFNDIEMVKYLSKLQKQKIEVYSSDYKLHILDEDKLITDEILFNLKDNKAQIIRILQQHTIDEKKIDFVERGKYAPLSFAQERLWFMDQYDHNASYNMPGAIRLFGGLNIEILENALLAIVSRHEVLRTNFVTINDEPKQVVHENPSCNLEIVNLSHLSKEDADKQILGYIHEESQKPFDLVNESLIRFILYTIKEEESVLFLNHHHIISDGWSSSILINEMTLLYDAFNNNKPSPLKELPIQYADYAIWQKEYLEGELLQKQADYWKSKLEGVGIIELPTDKVRPKEQTFNGNRLPIHLNKDIIDKLNQLSRKNDATLFMTLLSVFKILLQKYTGQADICVGSPISNRTREEVEGLIGLFVNTLSLRSDVNPELSFNDFLGKVKATTLEAYENQDIPFEKVVDVVEPERNLSYSPLFQVMMVLQNNPVGDLKFSGLNIETLEFESAISKFDITLDFIETANGLYGNIEYNTDLFESGTIERMAKHFVVLVEQITENSQKQIKDVEILTSAEKHQLLVDWNDTKVDYPKEKCIHQLFEEQVEKTPDNVAVVFEEEKLTYRQLNDKSNQLAHYLQKRGVKPESLVGICVERSLEMIVGLLGILKAGGAYVPIDPTYPKDRISYMLEDADSEIVLTQEHLDLPKTNSEIIYLDTDWDKIENEPKENVKSEVKSDNLAYVIYTSGSTGRPKGVMIEHGNVNAFLHWSYKEFENSEFDKMLFVTSICFDLSIFEMFFTLTTGKILEVLDNGLSIPEHLDSDHRLMVNTVPSVVDSLLSSNVDLSSVSVLNIAGEPIPLNYLGKLLGSVGEIRNLYGPSEDTTYSTVFRIDSESKVLIGRPISNTQVYILSTDDLLQPIGVVGELCLGGAGLARGYLNNPELTSEKFISHPFKDGERLYKTGDLGRYLPDGNIEFLGRVDDQVKIRGFRIELGEIESVVRGYSYFSSCVVLVKELSIGHKELVGYVVGESLDVDHLRNYLRGILPEYMIPCYFILLEALPLTYNGKVDKDALPYPDVASVAIGVDYVAPRNEEEKKLVDVWSDVLGVSKEYISVKANFFELGGNSFKIIRLLKRINKAFGYELTIAVLFRHPTIALFLNSINSNDSLQEIESLLDEAADVFNKNIALMNNNGNE